MKAGGKSLDPLRSHDPIAIATGARKQVNLLFKAFLECQTQFRMQGSIVPRSRCQSGRKRAIFESHGDYIEPTRLIPGLIVAKK